ncbi:poly-beta-1,6-N-acetyl-D-glucosamine biosynthesis protein PgaD [Aquitalea sp. LB_tupeE]|uniref:poly-beta-1,6-N-acetyl-D-glucosamine biosynthesis protein PgaD n=1 Tax=Aquitalea sp. LB_tupeE TaxID=2748078 RepID=UPI0015C11C56|nr:poly-beta-1,6-N-acetyl-D-glucosamine biosynthesis protein PgaD [Aquitalea sp. LB_tupeE]NWK79210.1 poly-beta-1,6-N-acetyl-D-glucosamine biosynthesis protein PgaD [Aquitalea sp. LB_tupeE]
MENSADQLIIEAPHLLSPPQRFLSWFLTTLGWVAWCYLWLPACQWCADVLQSGGIFDSARSSGELVTLGIYTLIGVTLGTALVVWAMSSYYKYKGVDRRKPRGNARPQDVARQLGIPLNVLHEGQGRQVMVVHHLTDGGIARVEALG